eukprot:gene14819-15000_t
MCPVLCCAELVMIGWWLVAGPAGEDIDPSTLEFIDDFDPAVQQEIAIAMEDIVNGTVKAVGKEGVTVGYTLEDGTEVEGLIHVSELLAPSTLAAADDEAAGEAEEYVEVDNIDPAGYYKVGDSISCFVFDVEDGRPLLTQRLPEDGDDELAELAEALEDLQDIEDIPDGLLVQGLWAAEEEAVDPDDEDAVDGDLMLEEVLPGNRQGAVAEAAEVDAEVEEVFVAAPEQVQSEVVASRSASSSSWNTSLMSAGIVGLRLPDRPV